MDYIHFRNLLIKSDICSIEEICTNMSISLSYFNASLRTYLTSITLSKCEIDQLKTYLIQHCDQFNEKLVSIMNSLQPNRAYFFKAQLASFVKEKYLLNDQEMTLQQAKFLIDQKWYSAKDIMTIREMKHNIQIYRYLKNPDAPYIKITTKNGEKSSITRYINLND